jgi:hypothetical protein
MKPIIFLLLFLYLPISAQKIAEVDTTLPVFDAQFWLNSEPRSIFTLEQNHNVIIFETPNRILLPHEQRIMNVAGGTLGTMGFLFLITGVPYDENTHINAQWRNAIRESKSSTSAPRRNKE